MASRLRKCLAGFVVVVGLGALAACSGGASWASASRGARRPRRAASAPARCAKVPASCASVRSTAPACAAPTFHSRCRRSACRWRSSFGDDLRPPGSIPNATRGAQPRWPVNEQPGGAGALRAARRRRGRRSIPGRCRRRRVAPRRLPRSAMTNRSRSIRRRHAGPAGEVYDFRRPYGAAPKAAPVRAPAPRRLRSAVLRSLAGAVREPPQPR